MERQTKMGDEVYFVLLRIVFFTILMQKDTDSDSFKSQICTRQRFDLGKVMILLPHRACSDSVPPFVGHNVREDIKCIACLMRVEVSALAEAKFAKFKCSCDLNFCNDHCSNHTKKHSNHQLSEVTFSAVCLIHDKQFCYFCTSDKKLLCSLCYLQEHKQHKASMPR